MLHSFARRRFRLGIRLVLICFVGAVHVTGVPQVAAQGVAAGRASRDDSRNYDGLAQDRAAQDAAPEPTLTVGFAATEITPNLKGPHPVWLAGYTWGRRATAVHDPLFARAVVLSDGRQRIALVSVDLVGLQLPEVQAIRRQLPEFDHIMVSSTHNHEGPDTIGIWGKTPFQRGVQPGYLEHVVTQVTRAIRKANAKRQRAIVKIGTARDDRLVGDSRKPYAKDGVLRLLLFESPSDASLLGLLVQWNCHPEALGPKNSQITADFCYATIDTLEDRYQCPVAYFSGAIGGLMAPPDHLFQDASGRELREGEFAYAEAYGLAVAKLATRAIKNVRPIDLTPFAIRRMQLAVPIRNPLYRTARLIGVLRRESVDWTGDFHEVNTKPRFGIDRTRAVRTEVGCLKLGQLIVFCIPGEIYPELVYGTFQDPVEPHVDYPQAPLERHLTNMVSETQPWMLFGLANDEIGYIIPKRQWDRQPPYAYGRRKAQYGEVNSCGVDVAPIIMQAVDETLAKLLSDAE